MCRHRGARAVSQRRRRRGNSIASRPRHPRADVVNQLAAGRATRGSDITDVRLRPLPTTFSPSGSGFPCAQTFPALPEETQVTPVPKTKERARILAFISLGLCINPRSVSKSQPSVRLTPACSRIAQEGSPCAGKAKIQSPEFIRLEDPNLHCDRQLILW